MLVPHGKPYAGKLHVRFDEGAGAPDEGRSALLYTRVREGLVNTKYPEYRGDFSRTTWGDI